MNAELDNIVTSPINDYIIRFEKVYTQSLHSDVKLINTIIRYISRKKGKQLRPRLCLLSAKLCGEPTENTYRAAALIEMIHVATLIHDDVVDDADLRRGWPSVNRVWKNKLSILVGDFMFSKALTNMIHLKDFDALDILSSTAQRLSQGEIQQIEKAIKKNMTEEVYYQMVSDKTASLFSAACKLGVMTVTEDNDKREALAKFGEKFGLVFQIKDDLLDITGNVEGLGKPAGFDLKKNILTLPLINLFEKLDSSDSKRVKRQLRNHVKKSELKEISMLIENHGGIQFAEKQIDRLSKEAQDELNIFPDSIYKDALLAELKFNSHRHN
ncbi:MAG: polyprenyl synthetase family protein [Candidatus Marinimicrobia bacterium]|nr:polyprenyl synthetase family protein [Candidatus Neomarinimicrobiota bacterium]